MRIARIIASLLPRRKNHSDVNRDGGIRRTMATSALPFAMKLRRGHTATGCDDCLRVMFATLQFRGSLFDCQTGRAQKTASKAPDGHHQSQYRQPSDLLANPAHRNTPGQSAAVRRFLRAAPRLTHECPIHRHQTTLPLAREAVLASESLASSRVRHKRHAPNLHHLLAL